MLKKLIYLSTVTALCNLIIGCCCPMQCVTSSSPVMYKKEIIGLQPELFINLGETCSVPDGMAEDSNGNVVLAVPNYLSYETHGAKIITINKDGEVIHTFTDLPIHPATGKVHPMGMAFGPDGNLYIADNHCFTTMDAQSRILRLNYTHGKPVSCDVVAEGTYVSNAVRWYGSDLYLTDSIINNLGTDGDTSGVFRFSLAELSQEKPVQADQNKHLIVTYRGEAGGFGADGMDFDKDGSMYVGLFSGGQFFKTTFHPDRSIKETICLMNSPAFRCCDGMMYDEETEKIYTTDSKMNAVWVYDLTSNVIQRLWENPDATGEDGSLDQPCEPLLYGDKLLVVNFDYTFPGLMNRENDSFNTISSFTIK